MTDPEVAGCQTTIYYGDPRYSLMTTAIFYMGKTKAKRSEGRSFSHCLATQGPKLGLGREQQGPPVPPASSQSLMAKSNRKERLPMKELSESRSTTQSTQIPLIRPPLNNKNKSHSATKTLGLYYSKRTRYKIT